MGNIQDPIKPLADSVYETTLPDGTKKEMKEFYLCGKDDTRDIDILQKTGTIRWEKDGVILGTTGSKITLTDAGNYKVYIEVSSPNGTVCDVDFDFTVYKSILEPKAIVEQPNCNNGKNGKITILNVGSISNNEYSLDGVNYQASNIFRTGNQNLLQDLFVKEKKGGCVYKISDVSQVKYTDMNITVNTIDWLCNDSTEGKFEINVDGGVAPYNYYRASITQTTASGGVLLTNTNNNQYDYEIKSMASGVNSIEYRFYIKDIYNCVSTISGVKSVNRPEEILANIKIKPNSCFKLDDGELEVTTISGGTAPYTYSINNGIYQTNKIFKNIIGSDASSVLSIKDANNCKKDISYTLIKPKKLNVSFTGEAPDCYGGNNGFINSAVLSTTEDIEFSIDGGLSFQDNTLFENLKDSVNYILKARYKDPLKRSCEEVIDSLILIVPEPLISKATAVDLTCSSPGEIFLSATGGRPPYNYSIDGGVNYTTTPTYTFSTPVKIDVIVRDKNGCTHSPQNFSVNNISDITSMKVDIGQAHPSCTDIRQGIKISEIVTPSNSNTIPDSVKVYKEPILDVNNPLFNLINGSDFNSSTIDIPEISTNGSAEYTFIVFKDGCSLVQHIR